MTLRSWFTRSMGRTREGTKAHLVSTADLLGCSREVLTAMQSSNDERCEALLIEHVSKTCGGTADWKEHHQDILETLVAFLSPEEAEVLRALRIDDSATPPKAIQEMDQALAQTTSGVRGLDTFGDFYILVVVPRSQLLRFDVVNKYWLASSAA